MNKTSQTYIDKTQWKEGPWHDEPDRVLWVDSETGYHCLIRRQEQIGILCGYVAVEKGHPFYQKGYEDLQCLDVHGGLTYSEPCSGDAEFGICHLTKDNDEAWWFGFDCNHSFDMKPCVDYFSDILSCITDPIFKVPLFKIPLAYRDIKYVTQQIESLAKQLKAEESAAQ